MAALVAALLLATGWPRPGAGPPVEINAAPPPVSGAPPNYPR